MKSKIKILALCFTATLSSLAQNSTFTPYSRYGLGELNQTTFAHNSGMGGAFIAFRPDSTRSRLSPVLINAGNPAAYSHIRLSSLEVGGVYNYSQFTANSSKTKKWGTNFAYGSLGFPIKRNGGMCLGIMPYSNVGYDVESKVEEANVGTVNYKFTGNGGLNKVFLGYGVMPFDQVLTKFKRKYLNPTDSAHIISHKKYMRRQAGKKILSDISVGVNVNYIFGAIEQQARVVYPNSILYNNTYRIRTLTMGDFTGNFGLQGGYTVDSVKSSKGGRRALKEKVKFTYGFFMSLNNPMKVSYDAGVYNYILNSSGQEIIRDTVLHTISENNSISLPLEQGFGVGIKKGERLNVVADFAITNWQNFKYLDLKTSYNNNYRVALGANYIPNKEAMKIFGRINYRFGLNYNTGFIEYKNTMVNNYAVSAGIGIPVGFGGPSAMINISAQYGQMGSTNNNLVKENYFRVNFGFTFSDLWFQKFKYD